MRDDTLPNDLVLLPAAQAAEILHHSPKTLERWRIEGFGPRWIRVGRKPLYRSSDLIDWLNANVVNSTSEPRPPSSAENANHRPRQQ